MARPRKAPATPFGAWLEQWLTDNQGVTFESFAQDIGVTKSAVSLWIGARKPVAIKPTTLRRIAMTTGADLGDLERMVYGLRPEPRPPADRAITLTPEELEALLERAAERAIRRVLGDQSEGRAA